MDPVWDEEKQGWRIGGAIVRLRNLEEYRQNEQNPVAHSPRNFSTVLKSIQQFGGLRSGVSSKGKLIAGNLTSEAMMEAGIEAVVEVESDGHTWLMHERPDLTEEQQRLAAYYDQQSSLLATWEPQRLFQDLEQGLPLTDVFLDFELGDLLEGLTRDSMEPSIGELNALPAQRIDMVTLEIRVSQETATLYHSLMGKIDASTEGEKFAQLLASTHVHDTRQNMMGIQGGGGV